MNQADRPALDQLSGLVERVTFHNPDNGFCVLRLKVPGERDLGLAWRAGSRIVGPCPKWLPNGAV